MSRSGTSLYAGMRRLLYEAAQSMMTRVVKWCWLKAWAMNIAKRHGSKKAKVALARRLAVGIIACGWLRYAPQYTNCTRNRRK